MPETMKQAKDPTGEELVKMQTLNDMVYHHDGGLGLIKRWFYDVFTDVCGGDNLGCCQIGEYSWDEEAFALSEVDRHVALGHTAYITRSPDYTDSEIKTDRRKVRIDYDKHEVAHRSKLSATWYELPDDMHRAVRRLDLTTVERDNV